MGELLNVIGLSAGVALYAMLLLMVARAGGAAGARSRVDPLLLGTALLGLIWNLCELLDYELPRLGVSPPSRLLTALGFSALGFLPAVVVHAVLRRSRLRPRWSALMIAVAYGVSAAAAVLHVWTGSALPSGLAMRLLTYTYIGLLVPLTAATWGRPGTHRTLWAALSLFVFAVSAMHLEDVHQGDPSWLGELLGHHASLPLAFAILYQDFPFAFADLFLKRALTLLALVTAAFVATASLAVPASGGAASPNNVGLLVTLWVATALLYPRLRALTARFVDSVVLARPDYDALRTAFGAAVQKQQAVAPLLDDACARLGPALSARVVRWRELGAAEAVAERGRRSDGLVVAVEIPVAEPPRYAIEIGELTGGRRLLSDDRAFLDAMAVLIGRRVDALRLTHERYERELREREIERLAAEAELRALRSQINPHFLFNALTTIGYLIQTAPLRAFDTLMRLTALLRGVLRSEGELTTLGRELDLIESYLDIERARFEERLAVRVDVPRELRSLRVPPLLVQPLVENAVKHGISPERGGGEVTVTARIEDAAAGQALVLAVCDTGAGVSDAALRRGREAGVGLRNIERRLACQYGDAATLSFHSAPGAGTRVEIRLPAETAVEAAGVSSTP